MRGIPGSVKDDDTVSPNQVDAQASCSCRYQEETGSGMPNKHSSDMLCFKMLTEIQFSCFSLF